MTVDQLDITRVREALGREAVARWRDLPWRATRNPWAVVVSEAMLQQTQVARVIPRYHEFLAAFPDVGTCAAAGVGAVVARWSGLGYNRRAVQLHRLATAVVERHGGVVPDDLDALLELPGIGPYTARAVLAFAYERDVAVVDTNIGRVLARMVGRPLGPAEVQELADCLVPPGRGWHWNQGLLDFGATRCTARDPACDLCPVAPLCAWRGGSGGVPDPARGSARVSRGQSRFEGSDRQGRGRLVAALAAGPIDTGDLAAKAGWPDDPARAVRVAATLITDGLAIFDGERYTLP